jgi:hypothetical protein
MKYRKPIHPGHRVVVRDTDFDGYKGIVIKITVTSDREVLYWVVFDRHVCPFGYRGFDFPREELRRLVPKRRHRGVTTLTREPGRFPR